MKILEYTILISLLGVNSSLSYGDSEVESLSPELRALLTKEMLSLENGMQAILPAYISGNFGEIAKIAKTMKNSYILEQEIPDHQKNELAEKLPEDFFEKDGQFHQYAGKLQHAAEEQNLELTGFFTTKLLESCVNCHSTHATDRFPDFSVETSEDEHHH